MAARTSVPGTTQRGVSGALRQGASPGGPDPAPPLRVRDDGRVTAAEPDGAGTPAATPTDTPQENVLVVTLDDPGSPTDPALDALVEPGDGFTLRSAAIVRRDADGAVTLGEHAGDLDTAGTLVERHPRLAGLLTALLAPIDTLLLGNSLVALTGALAEPSPDERVLLSLARAVPPGGTAVIADVVESEPQALDQRLAELAVTVTRRPLADVEADLAVDRTADRVADA